MKKGLLKKGLPGLKKGFTLIELLVVIAIIGILSGIVLTSLGTARDKARQSSATASLSSMRAQAELGFTSDGKYLAGLCTMPATTAGGLKNLVDAVNSQLGTAGGARCIQNAAPGTAPSGWAAIAKVGTEYFCVDSSGFAGTKAANGTTALTSVAIAATSAAGADVVCQ